MSVRHLQSIRILGAFLIGSWTASSAFGQLFPLGGAQAARGGPNLEDNTYRLKVTLQLDRSAYLPGEVAQVTVRIANPALTALEVFSPFALGTGAFFVDLQVPDLASNFRPGDPMCCLNGRGAELPTKWFAAGETLVRSLSSEDDPFGYQRPMFRVPQSPGNYKLVYYGFNASVNFSVLSATLGVDGYIPLQRKGQFSEGNRKVDVPLAAPVVAVDAEGKHYVVASVFPRGRIARDNSGGGMNWVGTIAPYVRIAESNQPITAISGEEKLVPAAAAAAVGKENLTVRWRTADGKQDTIELGPDRKSATPGRPVP